MSDKAVFRIVMGVSIFVFVAVVILNRKILPVPEVIPDFVYKLPKLYSELLEYALVLPVFIQIFKNFVLEKGK